MAETATQQNSSAAEKPVVSFNNPAPARSVAAAQSASPDVVPDVAGGNDPPREPWGWTRRHQAALAALTAFFIFFLSVQAWRHPFNAGAVFRTGVPVLSRKIDINTAGWASLARLPGIGPIRARKIVNYRKAHQRPGRRAFRRLADLRRIKGFGPKITARLAPFLTFGGKHSGAGACRRPAVGRAVGPTIPP